MFILGIKYGSWGYSQPSNHDNYQDCGIIDTKTEYKFGDEKCSRELQYICQISK